MDNSNHHDREEIYSKPVRAGKRTYFFDVKSTRSEDLYLTITESKKRTKEDGTFFFEKHKIFLYKEDFEKFKEGFEDAVNYITQNQPESPENNSDDAVESKHFSDINFEDLEK
jgi:hypothetical protein